MTSREEIVQCVSTLQADGWRLGKEIRPDQLWTALESSQRAA